MKIRKKRIGITNKKRFSMFFAAMLLILCCGFSSVRSYVSNSGDIQMISVFVAPGDTLWDIAIQNNPHNRDVRNLIHEIKKYNHLTSNTIHVGDVLLVPA